MPEEILDAARQVLAQGNDLPFLPLNELLPDLREGAAFETLRSSRIVPDASASVDMLLLQIKEMPPAAFMSEPTDVLPEAYAALARLGSNLGLPGSPLLSALLRFESDSGAGPAAPASRIIEAFRSLASGDVELAIRHMQALAELAKAGKQAAREVYAQAFRAVCSWPSPDLRKVMADVSVPTADGGWRPAREVAARVSGVADSHRLARNLEEFWPAGADNVGLVGVTSADQNVADPPVKRRKLEQLEQDCAASLEPVLKRAQADVPGDLLALLVGIVRQTKDYWSLVTKRLAVPEAKADQIWHRIRNDVDSNFVSQGPGHNILNVRQKTLLSFRFVTIKEVSASALTGERISLPAGRVKALLISGDEHQSRSRVDVDGRGYWLRVVTLFDASDPVEADDVGSLIKNLAVDCFGYHGKCIEILDGLAKECARVDQATVEDARARLEDRLPQILTELKPAWGTSLRRALNNYDREEGSLAAGKERTKTLPDIKAKLWAQVQSQEAKSELLATVRAKIEQFGYNSNRVLFELLQNADDAAVQHPPPNTARFKLAVSRERLSVLHWGRLINQFGVVDAEAGQRERWHHDLFNMLLMNLSDKREDVTGRFGLGFKSVHLLSTEVGIASGFLACRVRGGMLPQVWDAGREVSLQLAEDGRRATVLDIPIEPSAAAEADRAVIAFRNAARWLPAMTRRIRKIELTGIEPRVWTADFVDFGASGVRIVTLGGAEPGRALALDLFDETTLFVPLSADGPLAADLEVPRLWLLAPLAETLRSGWLMNGRRFRVDPGPRFACARRL